MIVGDTTYFKTEVPEIYDIANELKSGIVMTSFVRCLVNHNEFDHYDIEYTLLTDDLEIFKQHLAIKVL